MKDMYDYPSEKELREIVSNLKWLKQGKQTSNDLNDDGQSKCIEACYSPIQSWGATDYEDHRKDTLAMLRKLIKPKFSSEYGISQRGHFYDSNGNPVNTIIVRGYLGGYTGHFIYPSGTTAFNRKANKPEPQPMKVEA